MHGATTSSTGAATYSQSTWNWQPQQQEETFLVGDGPAECSSCTALSVLPGVIWDVNGYYRELGVRPTATRRQLMRAYQAKVGQDQSGQNSARLTYVLGQLLDPETRFSYDCTPLGELFLDRYVREAIMRQIKTRKSQRMANLYDAGIDLTYLDEDAIERDIIAEMGYLDANEDTGPDTPDEVVDGDLPDVQDDPRPAKFEYSYYLWGISVRADQQDLGRLAEWQRLLVGALARKGVSTRFAVGIHGRWHRFLHGRVGYREVFFLSRREQPTAEMAEAAVETMIASQIR